MLHWVVIDHHDCHVLVDRLAANIVVLCWRRDSYADRSYVIGITKRVDLNAYKITLMLGRDHDQVEPPKANDKTSSAATATAAVGVSPSSSSVSSSPSSPSRVLPFIFVSAVQCASCFKWRLIPTKEQYEQIREHILEESFFCETAKEWKPSISCDDLVDINQNGSQIWAIDTPIIAQPPPGKQVLLRIQGEGRTKFANVYYQAPSGKRPQSMVDIQNSFQIPRPLQQNYVRKCPAPPRLTTAAHTGRTVEPTEANSIA